MSHETETQDDENDWCEHVYLREESFDSDPISTQSPPILHDGRQEALYSSFQSTNTLYLEMPPQLHPACSIGFQRVSSCYFSLASTNHNESMVDLMSQLGENSALDSPGMITADAGESEHRRDIKMDETVDVFYHDILMQVFTFLDSKSLLSFSETARRPNFEVFYFLQLQLQQALLLDKNDNDLFLGETHSLSTVEGSSSILSRVAKSDMEKAREIVEEYQDSNSTLRTMPLSYSLAYVRHYLLRNGFHKMFPNTSHDDENDASHESTSKMAPSSQTLASAAVFMTVVGAASLVSSSDASTIAMMTDRFGSELPNALFRLGFVGSIMRAISDTERGTAMREKAEQMARSVPLLPSALIPTRAKGEGHDVHEQEQGSNDDSHHKLHSRTNFVLPSFFEMRHMLQEMMSSTIAAEKQVERQPVLSDPYDHLSSEQGSDNTRNEEKKICDDDENDGQANKAQSNDLMHGRKMPSGCVGAYSRAIHRASDFITQQVREKRVSAFEAMSPDLQQARALQFLDACTSNDTLDDVKQMISEIDVNRFYVGNDGTETCALHTAAFNGADRVVEFLCASIDHQGPTLDGGLCDVNAKDDNGWTALHFAAGSNSIAAVHVLARHGAALDVEAHNGYTPLSWAVRLSNDKLAEELKELMNSVGADHSGTWIPRQPLASIANRFLSLIPTQ